jgi:hypothetical protein
MNREDFKKLISDSLRRTPDRIYLSSDDYHNEQVEKINKEIKKIKIENNIKRF